MSAATVGLCVLSENLPNSARIRFIHSRRDGVDGRKNASAQDGMEGGGLRDEIQELLGRDPGKS